jgi:nicotinamidase-related amidase
VGWTGSFALKASNITEDINAPPDVMAVLKRRSLRDVLCEGGEEALASRRLFVCGLALDFCVLDTALNASGAGFSQVSILCCGGDCCL